MLQNKIYLRRSPEAVGGMNYGYETDDVKPNPFFFGLNAGKAFLTKFEFIPNGGKDGAEQEAIDIVFNINGTDKSFRMFPVVKAFGPNQEEITDPNAKEMKEAVQNFNSTITHILHTFMDGETLKAALARPFQSFKEFAQFAATLLPKDFSSIPLDIFLQWQWQMDSSQNKTFLEIPKKMKYGRWLTKAVPGNWVEKKVENPQESTTKALWYENEKGEEHPFIKNGWFMRSNFAHQQRNENATASNSAAATAMNSGNAVASNGAATETAKKSSW